MPRIEAMGGAEQYPTIPRSIEDFAVGLRTRHGSVVQDGELAIIWATDPFTGESAPFYPTYDLPRLESREEPIGWIAGSASRHPRVKVFLEPNGTQWCQYDDTLCKLENIGAPGFDQSVIRESRIVLNPPLQKLLAQRERRRKLGYKIGAAIAAAVVASIATANNYHEAPANVSPAPIVTVPPTPTTTPVPKPTRTPEPTLSPSPSETPLSSESSPKTATLNTAIANLLYDNKANKVQSILKTLFKTNHNEVVMVQEGNPFKKTVFNKIACEYKEENDCSKGIAMFPGIYSGGSGRNQIFWNTDRFEFVEGHSKLIAQDPDSRGRHFKHKRYATWVLLKDKTTDQEIYFVNVHAPNTAEKNGLPSHVKASVKAHKKFMKNLVEIIGQLQDDDKPVILEGDFNVGAKADNARCSYIYFPCRMLDSRMTNMWLMADMTGDLRHVGTQGPNDRLIDRVYYSETNDFKLTVKRAYLNTDTKKDEIQMTGGFEGSDHKPVNVQFTITAAHKKTGEKKQHSFTIGLDGVQNFRDAGASSGGQAINKYAVYRSGKLQNATKKDISKLSRLVTKVIDLRPLDVQAKAPDPVIPGVTHVSFPITSSSGKEEYIDNLVVNPADRKRLGEVLTEIANTKGAVIIHCTEGKDRTGWVTALLGVIGGAKEIHIENEYTLSKSSGKYVNVSWLKGAFTAAKEKFGTSILDGYIKKGLGLSNATIAKLRAKLSPEQ